MQLIVHDLNKIVCPLLSLPFMLQEMRVQWWKLAALFCFYISGCTRSQLRHVGPSSLITDGTRALCTGSSVLTTGPPGECPRSSMLRTADTAQEGPGILITGLNYQLKIVYTRLLGTGERDFYFGYCYSRNASILKAVWVFCHQQPRGPK